MRRRIRMRPYCFFVFIIVLFFTIMLAGCHESTDNKNGSNINEKSGSNDAGGDEDNSGRWVPIVGDTWQWQLQDPVNTDYDVDVYDIDLYDSSVATIQGLHMAADPYLNPN